jgi:RNA polymerase sigma-70 factor (ECF subfamily)
MRRGSTLTEDWAAAVDRLLEGDRVACLQISRLVTGFLVEWRAWEFRDEWSDLVQEVLIVVVTSAREGKIKNRDASYGFIRAVAHHKFVDRLRRHLARPEDQALPWADAIQVDGFEPDHEGELHQAFDLQVAMEKLDEPKREIVFRVYCEGKTYEQVAEETGIPLGTLKRHLRNGLAELRAHYDE